MMDLKRAINCLHVLAALAEADFKNDSTIRATTIMIDRDDVLALKGAAEILDGVRVMRRIMGAEAVKHET